MVTPRYKVLIGQIDSEELDFNTELPLDAENTFFDASGTGFDPSIDNVQDALAEIGNLDLKTLTEFEAFSDDAQESTTTNGWITKNNYPYTTASKTAGVYVIDFTSQIGQSDKEKTVGFRVQWRPGTSGTWITLVDVRNGLSADGGFELRSGFNLVTLPSDSAFQVRLQWGQTDDGGTGIIRNAGIKIGKVADSL